MNAYYTYRLTGWRKAFFLSMTMFYFVLASMRFTKNEWALLFHNIYVFKWKGQINVDFTRMKNKNWKMIQRKAIYKILSILMKILSAENNKISIFIFCKDKHHSQLKNLVLLSRGKVQVWNYQYYWMHGTYTYPLD